jgi:3,4-dihydroxy 2-butanone 4-phosphate synthase/GTP cyclohydrolase II
MARLPDLMQFAQLHGIKIATISDLIAYRRKYDSLVRRDLQTKITSEFGGEFDLTVYVNTVEYAEHIALVKGDITTPEPVLVRMHAVNIVDDLIGAHVGSGNLFHAAMSIIGEEGRGVLVLIRDTRPTVVSDTLSSQLEPPGPQSEPGTKRLIEYGVGAQILLDLGVREMVLLSNSPTPKIVGIEGYGLKVVGQRQISPTAAVRKAADGR